MVGALLLFFHFLFLIRKLSICFYGSSRGFGETELLDVAVVVMIQCLNGEGHKQKENQ